MAEHDNRERGRRGETCLMMSQTLKQNGSDKKQSDTFYLYCSLWGDKFESVSRLIDTDTVHLKQSDRGSFGSVCIVSVKPVFPKIPKK